MMFGKAIEMEVEEDALLGEPKVPPVLIHTSLKISTGKNLTTPDWNQEWNIQELHTSLLISIVKDH